MESRTLPNLLSCALRDLERAYIAEGAGTERTPSLDLWSNLLRVLDGKGVDRRGLPAMLRLSARAVKVRVSSASRRALVEELKPESRQILVRLAPNALNVAERWHSLQAAAEERWCAQVGTAPASNLREHLEHVVAMLPLEHPHYPASYGAADASITGGPGKDWTPVPRAIGGDTVSHLPLSALLSQALVAFAVDYEEKSPAALPLATEILSRIPREGRPKKGLGPASGLSALERHGFLRVSRSSGADSISLTSRGAQVAAAHDPRVQAVESDWSCRFGPSRVTALRRALEDLTPAHA